MFNAEAWFCEQVEKCVGVWTDTYGAEDPVQIALREENEKRKRKNREKKKAKREKKRDLCSDLSNLSIDNSLKPHLVMPGVLIVEAQDLDSLKSQLEPLDLKGIALITLVDDSAFVAADIDNWLWITFTRSNPAEDIFGLEEDIKNKHWSCRIPIIDARVKPHHAPAMHMPEDIIQMAQQKISNAL